MTESTVNEAAAPLPWIEAWQAFQRSDPATLIQRTLQDWARAPTLQAAVRQVFGTQSEDRAQELLRLMQHGVEADWGPLYTLLGAFGSALEQHGAEYRQLHEVSTSLRRELGVVLRKEPSSSMPLYAAMCEAVDRGLAVIGEEYVSARERRIRLQRQDIEQALRSSEMRFTRLFDAGIIGILICDLAGNIKEANHAFLDMVGYSRVDVLTGKVRWADMTPAEWRHLDDIAIEQLKAHGVTRTWEKEYLRKDGTTVPILVGVAMLNDSECIAFVLDISERRRLEALRVRSAELEAQNARVQESSRLKNEFLANMSHELRTPLNSIIGFADILYDGEVPPESPRHHELLGDILRSGRHLLQLINDVLDLAKVEAGKLDFRPEHVDLNGLFAEVASVLRSIASGKQIEIQVFVDPGVSEVVLDPSRLKQVLYNYVSNALKFTEPGGKVMMRARPEGAKLFRLEVEDTGIGIEPRDIPRLFVEFQQLDAGTAKKHAGTGLGLALTKRIIEAQSGSVGVTSTPGRGSVFFATLPLDTGPIASIEGHDDMDLTSAAVDGGVNVLVVEDDPRDRRLLTRILTDAGYGVDAATTGMQAVASCASRTYDAITLDLLLPDVTGLDVLHSIRHEGKNQTTPIVIVSVVAEKGVVGGYPVHDYLTKPINSQELLASLRRARVIGQGGGKIWVIDDDPSALKLMDTVLTQLGYQVSCHDSAERALTLLETERPAAIVLDLMMPGVDGFEFLARYRERPEHATVPIIVWTMKDLDVKDHQRLHHVAQAVLLKGYDRNQSLTQQMRHLLQLAIDA
ncbi:MAG: response regulator [Polyangiales bacterium]